MDVTSAPAPAVVGIAIKGYNLPFETFLYDINFFFKSFINLKSRILAIFAKSITEPPPIAIIMSGEKLLIFFRIDFSSLNSGNFDFLK